MVDKGLNLSKKYNVKYKYVECYLNDFQEVNYRLKNRVRMVSQISGINSEEDSKHTLENSKKPKGYQYLIVDTNRPLESYINKVINYIDE